MRLALAIAVVFATTTAHAAQALDFQQTFDRATSAGPLAYTATYRTADATHRVSVWRDGNRRIRRRTDDAIDSYVVKPASGDEWSMTVLDLKRRIRTDVARTNLMRIGYAENWFAQTHALAAPRGTYRLIALKTGPSGAVASCRWYRLDQPQRSSDICWSATAAIPLMIVDVAGTVVWRVESLSTKPIAPSVFTVTDAGYVRNDANADIEPD